MEDNTSSAACIHLVHRLIEECILFNMSQEECMEALSKHANVKPIITSTGVHNERRAVWKELEKENKEFFEAYSRRKRSIAERGSETEMRQKIHDIASQSHGSTSNQP